MPNIQEFDAGNLAIHPTETGVDARAKTAQRIGMFYNQQGGAVDMLARETQRLASETQQLGSETGRLGQEKGQLIADTGRRVASTIDEAGGVAVKYLAHQDISKATPAYAQMMAEETNNWNDIAKSANPNDPTIAAKFMSSLEDRITNFKENGFITDAGKAWAEAHTDALRQHFAETTTADMSRLAGQAAVVNQQQTINSLSSTVHGDPSSLDFALAALKSGTEGMISSSPNLTGVQAGVARSEILQKGAESIVKSAAIGYIEKTSKMPPWASDPKYAPYINGAELKIFENAAKQQAKVDATREKADALQTKQMADLKVHATATKTLSDNVSIDPTTGRPIINQKFFKDALDIARKNPDAPSAAATARTMLDWGESQLNKETKVTNPVTASALDERMFASESPTSKMEILRAEADGKLSRTDADIRSKIIDQRDKLPSDPQFKLAMDGAKQLIEGRTAGEKSLQSGKYAAFMQQFLGDYQRAKNAGTLPPNALSLRDPNSMLSKAMEAYKSPLASAISGNGGVSASPSFSDRFTGEAASSGIQPPATAKYNAGDVVNTSEGARRFKGGNFRDKKNWEPVS